MKKKTNETYVEPDFENILRDININTHECEVLYNLGTQEVLKRDGKYFLSSVMDSNICKEITRDAASDLWGVYKLNSNKNNKNNERW